MRGAERALDVPLPVIWQGKSSAGLCEFNELLDGLSGPTPSIIIVHLGTNDLVAVDEFSMRQRIALSMDRCLMQFPNTLLIWSDILPRVFYFGATIPAKIGGPLTCKQARKHPPHPPSMLVAQIIARAVQ